MNKNKNIKHTAYLNIALLLSGLTGSVYAMDDHTNNVVHAINLGIANVYENHDGQDFDDDEVPLADSRQNKQKGDEGYQSASDEDYDELIQQQQPSGQASQAPNPEFLRKAGLKHLLNPIAYIEVDGKLIRLSPDENGMYDEQVQQPAQTQSGNGASTSRRQVLNQEVVPMPYMEVEGVRIPLNPTDGIYGEPVTPAPEPIADNHHGNPDDNPEPNRHVFPVEPVLPVELLIGAGGQPSDRPMLNSAQRIRRMLAGNKRLVAGTAGVAVVVGVGGYVLRKPLYNLYKQAAINAKNAWQKLQRTKVTKGHVFKGALGLAGTTATAYAAHQAYKNPEALRNLLSNRKAQAGAAGLVTLAAALKLGQRYLSQNTAYGIGAQNMSNQRSSALNDAIEYFETTLTPAQYACPGIDNAFEALAQGDVSLLKRIFAFNGIVFTDVQEAQLQAIDELSKQA